MKYALVLVLLLAACTQVDTPIVAELEPIVDSTVAEIEIIIPKSYTIVALGDSLTAGPGVPDNQTYPAILQTLLRAEDFNATVINAGVNGETSNQTLTRVNDALAHNPDIVILETRVNDILSGVPGSQTVDNINAIIDELQANNITVILAGMEAFGEYQGFRIEVQTMYPSIAETQDVLFIPFFLEGVAGIPEYNLQDRVHPNEKGYYVIAERNVLPVVIEAIDK